MNYNLHTAQLRTLGMALAALIAFGAEPAQARLRELSDTEMDEVCAKGTIGTDVDLATVRELVFQFAHHNALAAVAGSLRWTIEASSPNPAQVQVSVGNHLITPGAPVALDQLDTINIRAVDAQVRVTGDINLSITPSPNLARALERHQELINSLTTRGLVNPLAHGAARGHRGRP